MSRTRKLRERPAMPKALVCGMLKDGGRVLFLKRKDRHGIERLEIPCTLNYGEDPVAQIAAEFRRQTGIDAEAGEIAFEAKHNAGSRRRKRFVPCLVFMMRAKSMQATPAAEFSGFRWLSLDEAKKEKLGRVAEWLRFR